jgi:integrase
MWVKPGGGAMNYYSAFATYIVGLIEQKRALGYKYESQPLILKRFDAFCLERYSNETELCSEIVLAWAVKRPNEKPATLQGRVTPVSELARYMIRLGIPAFILPKDVLPRSVRYIPHIYTNDELKRIFQQTDKCCYCNQVPHRHFVMPVFFRLLYSCGLRLSEARLLKVCDVDLERGVITIKNAKLDKHRQLPVSPQMLIRLREYHKQAHLFNNGNSWFFPGYGGKPMTMSNVENNLYRFLRQAGISRSGRYSKPNQPGSPNVHAFRHTFAVHCLRKWVFEEKDLRAYLPVLQAYLGHVDFADTAYYLHLTADLFPNITKKVQATMGDIIPKARCYNETD